eukprot:16292_1
MTIRSIDAWINNNNNNNTIRSTRTTPYDVNKNHHLQLWLHTTHLLSKDYENKDEFLNECIHEISNNIFNGMQDLLNWIAFNCKYNKLQKVHKIIKDKALDNVYADKPKALSSFCSLSTASIANICTYLKRDEISSLKLTSYDIGTVCLQHMTNYKLPICQINKLIKYPSCYK